MIKTTPHDHLQHSPSEQSMLKNPFMDTPYIPNISHILGALSIYDLENTVGKKLRKYNPNNTQEREKIIRTFVLKDLMYLSYRHRYYLILELEKALKTPKYNFAKEFKSDYDEHITMAWDETEIDDPRLFFEDILLLANEEWKDDLQKASLEDQSTW